MSSQIEDTSELKFEWLNEELFEPIFEKELNLNKTEFTLKLVSVKLAVGIGENYVAQVTRVQVEVTLNSELTSYGFIIKSSITQMVELKELNIFEKEMEFYTDVAPKLDIIDPNVRCSPKCYFIGNVGDIQLIILEDLSGKGFKMADRLVGLDLEHCKLFFNKLGAFHALTATYCENNKVSACFEKSTFGDEMKSVYAKIMKLSFPLFTDMFKRNENLRRYLTVIKDWDKILFEAAKERIKINPDDFNVLNHGDSWTNNLLFSYDSYDLPSDVWLIDFQLACYCSPIFDIFHFFITSPNMEVRENHFDELVQIYHMNLVGHLEKYNYSKPIPTLRQLHMDILNKGFFSTILFLGIASVVVLDTKDSAPIEEILQDNENGAKLRYNIINNPRYIKLITAAMKFLQNRGLLEA